MTESSFWRCTAVVPGAWAEAFAEALGEHAASLSAFEIEERGDWRLDAVFHGEPDRGRIAMRLAVVAGAVGVPEPEVEVEPIPPTDWLGRSYAGFPPIRAGRFFVHGSHHRGPVPPGSLALQVDAATAFGSGEHATTKGCLLALDRLARRLGVARALDMGCGSGILALAVAKRWRASVTAVDIDAESVRVTRENVRRNRVAGLVRAEGGNGYATPIVRQCGPYDLIVANILARPLARMAPDLRRHLRPGGTAVLSGLLARQERHVLAAHLAQGLRLVGRVPIDEWRTLVLRG